MFPFSLLTPLLTRVVDSGLEARKTNRDFKMLRALAYERISRELFWNSECLAPSRSEEKLIYFSLVRTDAFDGLVKAGAPLDFIFSDPVLTLTGVPHGKLPKQMRIRLKSVTQISMLLDRTYNRTWMLRHRVKHQLSLGDVSYLRQLIRLSMSEVAHVRHMILADIDGTPSDIELPMTDIEADDSGRSKTIW